MNVNAAHCEKTTSLKTNTFASASTTTPSKSRISKWFLVTLAAPYLPLLSQSVSQSVGQSVPL